MDEFRVGSVPPSDPYGHRRPSGAIARKREKQRDGEGADQQDDVADVFGPVDAGDLPAATAGETIEDYYLPSDPSADGE
jgi:hypothetical protein